MQRDSAVLAPEARARELACARAYLAGMTVTQIAREMRLHPQRVYQLVHRALLRYAPREYNEARANLRMMRDLYDDALDGF
jgi:hypothetical protein